MTPGAVVEKVVNSGVEAQSVIWKWERVKVAVNCVNFGVLCQQGWETAGNGSVNCGISGWMVYSLNTMFGAEENLIENGENVGAEDVSLLNLCGNFA